MSTVQKTVTVKSEHLQAALDYMRGDDDKKAITHGCLMNQALRDAFPQYPIDSHFEGGSDAHGCSWSGYYEPVQPRNCFWAFDENGRNVVQAFDHEYPKLIAGATFSIALPVDVTLTQETV